MRNTISTTTFGFDVIRKLLEPTGKHKMPVYIDVKHMDIKARFQYYAMLKKEGYKNIPIIASHVAASGKDSSVALYTGLFPVFDVYEEVSDLNKFYYNQASCNCLNVSDDDKSLMNWFYPWSINLCNQEIPLIYESDGIIGITLEERVLGNGRPNYDFFYNRKMQQFLADSGINNKADIDTFRLMQPLLRNVFHFVKYSGRNDKSAWEHLAIGSDFDGIMKPVKYCPTAAHMRNLHRLLVKYLPLFASFSGQSWLLYNMNPGQIADNLIFKNGERFKLKYF